MNKCYLVDKYMFDWAIEWLPRVKWRSVLLKHSFVDVCWEENTGKKKIKYPWGYEINRQKSKTITHSRDNGVGIYLFTIVWVVCLRLSSQICQYVTSLTSLKCSWCSLNVICSGPSKWKEKLLKIAGGEWVRQQDTCSALGGEDWREL